MSTSVSSNNPAVLEVVTSEEIMLALGRHLRDDWGELDPEDWAENERSLMEGFRLLSSYRSANGIKFWIITEHDRSSTTVLLPSDY